MLQQRYSYSDTVRQSGVCIVRLYTQSVKHLQYSMYRKYEHAQNATMQTHTNTYKLHSLIQYYNKACGSAHD